VVLGPPAAPTNATLVAGNASALISWKAPTNQGSSPISEYDVTPYVGATAQPVRIFGPGTTSATITGLANGSLFSFRVAAVNAEGPGVASDPIGSFLIGVPGPVGAKPTAVVGNGQVKLSWPAAAGNGGPINGYVVTLYRAGVMQFPKTFNSAATTETITGLTNGVSYTFQVAARNAYGQGASSLTSTAVIVGLPPLRPTKVKAVRSAKGSLRVTFTEAINDSTVITKFTATCKSTNKGVARSKAGPRTPLVVTKLTAGKTYKCTVTATNSRGTSPASKPTLAVKA
jgi:titin